MPELPSGTVTFVFSDLEGSTRLLTQLGDERYAQLLASHRRLVRDTFARHGGSEIDTQGDAFFYSFARARAAVAAAVEVQRRHAEQKWPGGVTVSVRLGLHTGEPVVGDEGYTGLDVVRAARIAADGKGGQILLSEATRAIVGSNLPEGVEIRGVGERALKDIDRPEPLYELVYGAAPEVQRTQAAEAAPASGTAPAPTGKSAIQVREEGDSMTFDVDPSGLMKQWKNIARSALDEARAKREAGEDYDPGKAIEERVMAELERTLGGVPGIGKALRDSSKPTKPPKVPNPSDGPGPILPSSENVADRIARLAELRDDGALSDEQYTRAVDKLLGES